MPFAAIRTAYLYGSQLGSHPRADSDLDLAVRFDDALAVDTKRRLTLDLIDALARELGPLGERADVVDLSDADPAVAFRAIQGTCVACRSRAERTMLEARVAICFEDDAPRRDLYRRAALRRWAPP